LTGGIGLKKRPWDELCWFAVLMAFYIYICLLLAMGKITYFIHPRMIKYTEVSVFVLIILAANELIKISNKKTRTSSRKGYLLFIIPLLLGFIVAPNGLNASMADKKGFSVQSYVATSENSSDEVNYLNDGRVIFNDNDYVNILNDISSKPRIYANKIVNISGFVYRDSTMHTDEFVISRFLMICCAADIQLIGLEGKWNKARALKSGEWIDEEGIISYTPGYDSISKEHIMTPIIKIKKINPIDKPEDEYIYP
jgi:putative membrane protein